MKMFSGQNILDTFSITIAIMANLNIKFIHGHLQFDVHVFMHWLHEKIGDMTRGMHVTHPS